MTTPKHIERHTTHPGHRRTGFAGSPLDTSSAAGAAGAA